MNVNKGQGQNTFFSTPSAFFSGKKPAKPTFSGLGHDPHGIYFAAKPTPPTSPTTPQQPKLGKLGKVDYFA